jgi:hypothetical protein
VSTAASRCGTFATGVAPLASQGCGRASTVWLLHVILLMCLPRSASHRLSPFLFRDPPTPAHYPWVCTRLPHPYIVFALVSAPTPPPGHRCALCVVAAVFQERHDAGDEGGERRDAEQGLVSKWRQKDKLKTTGVTSSVTATDLHGTAKTGCVVVAPAVQGGGAVGPETVSPSSRDDTLSRLLLVAQPLMGVGPEQPR